MQIWLVIFQVMELCGITQQKLQTYCLSLATVQEHRSHITYDSREGNKFTIYKPDGTRRVFSQIAAFFCHRQ
jgi:hypothetical protein